MNKETRKKSEALVTATELDFDQGRLVSRSTVVCR
jgi:hypothetical protein